MRRIIGTLALAGATAFLPRAAAAQDGSLGLALGIVDPDDVDSTLWTTVNFRIPVAGRLYVEPEVGFWRKSEGVGNVETSLQDLNLGANVLLELGSGGIRPWVGAGLGAHILKLELEVGDQEIDSESDTELGVHLLGGLDFELDRDLGLFAAARYDIVNTEDEENLNQVKVYGGLRVLF